MPHIRIDRRSEFSQNPFRMHKLSNALDQVYIYLIFLLLSPFQKLFSVLSRPTVFYILSFSFLAFTLLNFSYFYNVYLSFSYISILVSFFLMFYASISVLQQQSNLNDFYIWETVFKAFSPDLNTRLSLKIFNWKSFRCYINYFISLLVYLVFMSFISDNLLFMFIFPLVIIISCLMFISLLKQDVGINIFNLSLWLIAHCTYFQDQILTLCTNFFPDFHQLTALSELPSVQFGDWFLFELSLDSAFQILFISSLLFSFWWSLGLKGFLHFILAVSWFRLIFLAYPTAFDSNWMISYATCFWILIFVLPLVPFDVIFYTFLSGILAISAFAYGCDLYLALFAFLTTFLILTCLPYTSFSNISNTLKYFLVLLSITSLVYHYIENSNSISTLKWDQYQTICLPPKDLSTLMSARNCRPLTGNKVQWQAIVKQVDIINMSNWVQDILTLFPKSIKIPLECFIGDSSENMHCDNEYLFLNDAERNQCLAAFYATDSECSIHHWNKYKFHIIVSMESNFWKFRKHADIILKAGHDFEQIAFKLMPNDRISFVGVLNDICANHLYPELDLLSLNCADCERFPSETIIDVRPSVNSNTLFKALQLTMNFFFGPMFSFLTI